MEISFLEGESLELDLIISCEHKEVREVSYLGNTIKPFMLRRSILVKTMDLSLTDSSTNGSGNFDQVTDDSMTDGSESLIKQGT